MYHSPTLFPAATKIVELLIKDPKAPDILLPQLMQLKNEIAGTIPKDNMFHQMDPHDIDNENEIQPLGSGIIQKEDDDNSTERRLLSNVKNTMSNYGAINFLEKLQSDNRMNTAKLRQLAVILAGKTGIETRANQFKTTEQIYQWIDINWDIIEPRVSELIVLFCDGK